ncbi:MAG: glycosyltransferase [Bdellovibrionales bacterium]
MPIFTVATITRNNAQGIEKTWNSLKNQTLNDYEWLVQDAASNDETLKFLKNTTAQTESRADNGIYDAMNRLIERANGQYILFLNAGDQIADDTILETIAKTMKDQTDFIYGDAIEQTLNQNGHLKKARNHNHITLGMFTHHQAMIYKKAAISDLRYDLSYQIAADYKFTAQFLLQSNYSDYIPQPLCIFESGGTSQNNTKISRNEQYQIRKELKLCSPFKNKAITVLQFINLIFRRLLPNLYWSLKH